MLRAQAHSLWTGTPIPYSSDAPVFHSMHDSRSSPPYAERSFLKLLTWNIDSKRPQEPGATLNARLDHIAIEIERRLPDVVGLQEVSQAAHTYLLGRAFIDAQYSSTSLRLIRGATFGQVTFIRRGMKVREVFTIPLPSYQCREALALDVEVYLRSSVAQPDGSSTSKSFWSAKSKSSSIILRLINVHLESLHHTPCFRPRQVAQVAQYLDILPQNYRAVVFGDMNPVQDDIDARIPHDLSLTDAWEVSQERLPLDQRCAGHTWGLSEKMQIFPPARFDRVWYRAVDGFEARSVEVLNHEGKASDHCAVMSTIHLA